MSNQVNNEDRVILLMTQELVKTLVQVGLIENWAMPMIINGVQFFLPRIPKPVKQRLIVILRRYICGGGNGV
jgi:antibiotic biosynthesis monooxygenase (ABM) superfamily enzyme